MLLTGQCFCKTGILRLVKCLRVVQCRTVHIAVYICSSLYTFRVHGKFITLLHCISLASTSSAFVCQAFQLDALIAGP